MTRRARSQALLALRALKTARTHLYAAHLSTDDAATLFSVELARVNERIAALRRLLAAKAAVRYERDDLLGPA